MNEFWPVTVKPTKYEAITGVHESGYHDPEEKPKRIASAGFCTNYLCFGRPNRDSGRCMVSEISGFVYLSTKDQSKIACSSCHHALFWSKSWTILSDKDCKAKGFKTLSEIYDSQKQSGAYGTC